MTLRAPKDLSEIECWFFDVDSPECRRYLQECMMDGEIVYHFANGREATPRDLVRKKAGDELIEFAKSVVRVKRCSLSEAWRLATKMHPRTTAQYLTGR